MGFVNFGLRLEYTTYTSPDNVGHSGPKRSTPGLIQLRSNINMTLGETLKTKGATTLFYRHIAPPERETFNVEM